jgi:hypothetical protein
MSAQDAVALFVDVLSDFPKVDREGHDFLHGPRGSGKSMMFRYLTPDCQCLAKKCRLNELTFYGIWVKLKNTDLKLTELQRLENRHADTVLNEHFMTVFIAEKVFSSLMEHNREMADQAGMKELRDLMKGQLEELLHNCGWHGQFTPLSKGATPGDCVAEMARVCRTMFTEVVSYLKRLSFTDESLAYSGPLCGYLDFLFPLLCAIRELSFMPKTCIYLLIDDADNLNTTQTQILNTWVSTRTQARVSLKISTQMGYKTYRTVCGQTIDTPHDYSEVNISTTYTASKRTNYVERIRQIVSRRLTLFGIKKSPEEFFPRDEAQEAAIRAIYDSYVQKWSTTGKGYRPEDDAYRYARPDYMRSLSGQSKSRYSYSYSGFEQLVHLSSGIIRYFLEPAAIMFSETVARNSGSDVLCIPPGIQNKIVREQADDFLFDEFEKLYKGQATGSPDQQRLHHLYNLIRVLGGTFGKILISDRSERRVFSVAFYEEPSQELQEILDLGIKHGYFHVSAIGNKDGTGRTKLYILSRRLAPHFFLDPTSFAGYLFASEDQIWEAMQSPDRVLRRVDKEGAEKVFEPRQLKLFD